MSPPTDKPSILDGRDNFDRYMKAAEEDETRVLALVAKGIDGVMAEQVIQGENFTVLQSDFQNHRKAPVDEAHPPGKNKTETESVKMTPKTLIRLIVIVSVIATGGSALAAYLGIIGG